MEAREFLFSCALLFSEQSGNSPWCLSTKAGVLCGFSVGPAAAGAALECGLQLARCVSHSEEF